MLETDSHLKEQVKLRMILIEGELIRAEQKARLAMFTQSTYGSAMSLTAFKNELWKTLTIDGASETTKPGWLSSAST